MGVVGGIEDIILAAFKESSEEYRKKFADEGIKRYFGPIEKLYAETEEGPFLLGKEISAADLKLYVTHGMFQSGMLDHIPTDILDQFPNLMKASAAVGENDKVKEWNAKH